MSDSGFIIQSYMDVVLRPGVHRRRPHPWRRNRNATPSIVMPRSIAISALNGVHFSSRPFFTASSMIADHGSMKYFPVGVAADDRVLADATHVKIVVSAG